MSLKHGILGLLNYKDMTGYDLSKTFSESLGFFWQAQTSQIYRDLNSMEQEGWLSSSIEFQTDKPNKRIYSITEEGKMQLKSWLDIDSSEQLLSVKNLYLMKLFFAANLDSKSNIASLWAVKTACENELMEMSGIDDSIENYAEKIKGNINMLYWGMTAEFGRAYLQMCIQWAEDCIKKIEELE